ncbi:MAG: nucleotidyl transferase AbiEii/AbiGii toxin family protein [Pyrinomonadaceae bacterium]
MKQVLEAAKEIQTFLEEQRWKFCFIGGISLQAWAIPRNTNDADITLLTGIGSEEQFIETLLERFTSRINDDQLEFFLQRRVVLINIGGVGIDISLGALEFEESAVKRSTYHDFLPGIRLRVCSPEDLIVFKAFANRLKDWADVESVLSVQTDLDWRYIDKYLSQLVELKEEPEILTTLNRLRTK